MDDLSKINENKNEEKFTLEALKVTTEKYPMAKSKNMFESFFIIGYDDIYIKEIISQKALSTLELAKNQMKKTKIKPKIKWILL